MKSAVGNKVRRGSPPAARRREAGLVSAEYAIGTCAAAAFAAVLLAVINSGGVSGMITGVIQTAFEALF